MASESITNKSPVDAGVVVSGSQDVVLDVVEGEFSVGDSIFLLEETTNEAK